MTLLDGLDKVKTSFYDLNNVSAKNNVETSNLIVLLNNMYNKITSYDVRRADLESKVVEFIENHVKKFYD